MRSFLFICVFLLTVSCSDDDPENPCRLEPEVGECDAAIPIYYFDQEDQECKEFIWGGCGGVVPFETMQECLECVSQN